MRTFRALVLLALGASAGAAQQAPTREPWDDTAVWGIGVERPRATSFPFETRELALARVPAASARYRLLNGDWKFHCAEKPADRPAGFHETGFDDRQWRTMPVPGNLELNGCGYPIYVNAGYPFEPDPPFAPRAYNPVGSYRTRVEIPASWSGSRIVLHFAGMGSAATVWLNGERVGYAEDTKTPQEFDITRFARPGENLLAVELLRWSDASYLEDQDFWRLSGIERDVYIYSTPLAHVRDVFAIADLDDTYTDGLLDVRVRLANYLPRRAAGHRVSVELLDERGAPVLREPLRSPPLAVDSLRELEHALAARVPRPRPWTAETPSLYTLLVTLTDPDGRTLEVSSHRIGFRRVEIRGGLLLVNGRPITIKGVNRHETHPRTGHVISEASMLEDILLMKRFNVNAVRTSHYPNAPRFYELADSLGLYIVDEANIESHGMGYDPARTLGNKPEWLGMHLDRTQRLVERDKNHPSVIIWSLGNEAGNGVNFYATYGWTRARDRSRPVQYERSGREWNTDIYVPMYARPQHLIDYGERIRDRPLILCEYAHAMGNSLGNFVEYWEIIDRYPNLQGGFIWDWVDQGLYRRDARGREFFAYGGDFGPPDVKSDINFLMNGIVAADRTPHPHAWEMRRIYQYIRSAPVDLARGEFRVHNRYDFRDLADVGVHWRLRVAGVARDSGTLALPPIAAGDSATLRVPLSGLELPASVERHLELSFRRLRADDVIPAGWEVAWQQFALPVSLAEAAPAASGEPLRTRESATAFQVSGRGFELALDRTTGRLSSYRWRNAELLEAGPQPDFWRAPTDNDFGARLQQRWAVWRHAGDSATVTSTTLRRAVDGRVHIDVQHTSPAGRSGIETSYTVSPDGAVHVTQRLRPSADSLPRMLRFGAVMTLPRRFDRLTWFGPGPHETYWDRKTARVAQWTGTVREQFHPYPRPQETGNHAEVRWAALRDAQGRGLVIAADSLLEVTALHYLTSDLDEGPRKRNRHPVELVERDLVRVNVDLHQMGVGGIDSWGALPLEQYLLPYREYVYGYTLRGLSAGEDPSAVATDLRSRRSARQISGTQP